MRRAVLLGAVSSALICSKCNSEKVGIGNGKSVLFNSFLYIPSHCSMADEGKEKKLALTNGTTSAVVDKAADKDKAVKPFYTIDSKGTVTIDTERYERMDEKLFATEKFSSFKENNAVHDTLKGEGKIEKYEIYKKIGSDEIVAIVRFGSKINGHPTVVHGGITATIFDNTFGWLFFSLNLPMAVTANLSVNYRSMLPQNTTCILHASLEKLEGRKMHMKATLQDCRGKLIADSTSLFVAMKPLPWYVRPFAPQMQIIASWWRGL